MSSIISSVRASCGKIGESFGTCVNNLKPVNWNPEGHAVRVVSVIPVLSNVYLHLVTRYWKAQARAVETDSPQKCAELYGRAHKLAETMSTFGIAQVVMLFVYTFLFTTSNRVYQFSLLFMIATQAHHFFRAHSIHILAKEAERKATPQPAQGSSDQKDPAPKPSAPPADTQKV